MIERFWLIMDKQSLNPYFNGIYFLIRANCLLSLCLCASLNPYFNGIYFLINKYVITKCDDNVVLILILMEYTF